MHLKINQHVTLRSRKNATERVLIITKVVRVILPKQKKILYKTWYLYLSVMFCNERCLLSHPIDIFLMLLSPMWPAVTKLWFELIWIPKKIASIRGLQSGLFYRFEISQIKKKKKHLPNAKKENHGYLNLRCGFNEE